VSAGSVVGRDAELVVVEGEPGIGKTTVWQAAVRRAEERETRVLASRPGASEARLTFVGLTDLLSGVGDEVLDELPAPQRRALDVALLRADPEDVSSDQRVVATAFMSVLRTLSSSVPVVVAIDDLQWLDTPSWAVLEFALRRLETEPVGVVSAVRLERGGSAQRSLGRLAPQNRVRRVRLGPLNLAALHEILRAELGCTFPRPTLVRIERASSGNPFFALELARAILERGEPVVGSAALPVPENLVELLERRLRRLSAASRQALLVASALTQQTLELVDRDAVALAEDAGVVRVDERGRIAFTHPLLASHSSSSSSPAGSRISSTSPTRRCCRSRR